MKIEMGAQLHCAGGGWGSLEGLWALGKIIYLSCHVTSAILYLEGRQLIMFIMVNHCNICSASLKGKRVDIHMYKFYDSYTMTKITSFVYKNHPKKHVTPTEVEKMINQSK